MVVGIVYIAGIAFGRLSSGTLVQISEVAAAGADPENPTKFAVVLRSGLQLEIPEADVPVIQEAIASLPAYTISGV